MGLWPPGGLKFYLLKKKKMMSHVAVSRRNVFSSGVGGYISSPCDRPAHFCPEVG